LNLLIYMYIIEAFIAIILNQTPNSRHSVYYATLFALYSFKLHAAFINVVDYILQRYIQKAPVALNSFCCSIHLKATLRQEWASEWLSNTSTSLFSFFSTTSNISSSVNVLHNEVSSTLTNCSTSSPGKSLSQSVDWITHSSLYPRSIFHDTCNVDPEIELDAFRII
ncbi:hypothetical protein T11_826, partial [Trichinella zimbabwensis]